ncbi:MAG: hypothetical protein ACTHV2_14085 [Brachybacterium sp.]|uniref:hypothetical protein n=1 Tax=Brachybacterium sp. TaxID=1891286 RepID=UPI0026533EA1|nr:hypothetical protein [Brachybacterium sp.]MDN6328042.1 hypothetical protein [Brachybacterium sp.]
MISSRTPLRLARGGTAATLVTLLALGGHLVGGGAMPSWVGVALPWWLSVTVCTVLAGARFSLPRMGIAVLASQALFHGLFIVGTPGDPGAALVAPPGSHLGHGAHGASEALHSSGHSGHGSAEVAGVADHGLHGSHSDPQMLLWHLVAGLVATLVLHQGERFLLRCAGLVAAVLDVLARPPRAVTLPVLISPGAPRPVPARASLRHLRRAAADPQLRRGPPVVLAA